MALRVVVWVQGDLYLVDPAGSKARSQEASHSVSTPEELAVELRMLLSQGKRGSSKSVLFITDSQLLLPALEEVPPADGKLAAKLLAKRVEKAKLINEPFSLGIQPIVQPGDKPPPRRYLVTVGPLAWMKQLDAIVTETGHMLVGVLPLAVGLRPQLRQAASPAGQPFLMVLGIEKAMYQVVGRSDGTILFYRSLSMAGGGTVDSLQREVRRTLLFAEQKLNLKIPLILLSQELESLQTGMELGEGVEVQILGRGITAPGVGASLARFSPSSLENVLPREIALRQNTRRWRMCLNLGLVGMITFTVAWVATKSVEHYSLIARCLKEEGFRRTEQVSVERLQNELREYFRDADGVRVVEEETLVPVAELIVRSLPEAIPAGFVLNRCQILLDEKIAGGAPPQPVYQIRLEGRTRNQNEAVLPLVAKLRENLEKKPWEVVADIASGEARAGPEVAAELKGPGRFYFYGHTR